MARSEQFWRWFNTLPLNHRKGTFTQIFAHLDQCTAPVIVETGCVRKHDSFNSDGHSTGMFDLYAETGEDVQVYSIDIDPEAIALCRSIVGLHCRVLLGDSLEMLPLIAEDVGGRKADLLYLDSFDVDPEKPSPAAEHHMQELMAAMPLIGPNTLVVVDDCFYTERDGVRGKGLLVAQYAAKIGATVAFLDYQCGWTGMNRLEAEQDKPGTPRH